MLLVRGGTPPGQGGIEILARVDCGRPCDLAATFLAALRVLRASGPVPRQNGGHSSYSTVTVAENCGGSAVAVPGLRMLCSTVDTNSASAWETFGKISGLLREWVFGS